MHPPAAVARDISGTYRNEGAKFCKEGGGAILPARLSEVFDEIANERGFCAPARLIQLRQIAPGRLEIVARNDAAVVTTKAVYQFPRFTAVRQLLKRDIRTGLWRFGVNASRRGTATSGSRRLAVASPAA